MCRAGPDMRRLFSRSQRIGDVTELLICWIDLYQYHPKQKRPHLPAIDGVVAPCLAPLVQTIPDRQLRSILIVATGSKPSARGARADGPR